MKKAIEVTVSLALVSLIALLLVQYGEGKQALAAPAKEGQTASSQGSEGHTKCTILLHEGRRIVVDSSNALPAHLRHRHGDRILGAACQTEQRQTEEPPEETSPPEEKIQTPHDEVVVVQKEGEPEQRDEKTKGTETVKTCDDESIELKADEKRLLDLHNETRKKQGLESLCIHPALTKAARDHSKEMIDKDYFSHTSKDGQTPDARLKRFGYDWRAYGENIARGSGPLSTPDDRFEALMKSPGHRKNILDKNFREVGVGAASGEYKGTGGTTIYTVDFGTRRR